MKKLRLIKLAATASAVALLGISTQAQTLLYQWTFNGGTGTPDVTAGGGTLSLTTISGTGSNLGYNSSGGPGIDGANGALTVSGGGYNGGNTTVATAHDLTGLGTLSQVSVGFWFNLGSGVISGGLQLPRLVMFGAATGYDVGGKGTGNFNGIGTSINNANTVNFGLQNGVAGAAGTDPAIGSNPGTLSPNTWYYELVTYDGTLTANNFLTYIGTSPETLSLYGTAQTANFGAINFGASATVDIANNADAGVERAVSTGSIANVEIWSGLEPVPEPSTLALIGLGLGSLAATMRRRQVGK